MRQAIESGHISGDGGFTKRCHALLEEITGAKRAFLTTSCTHALEMAMLLLDLEPRHLRRLAVRTAAGCSVGQGWVRRVEAEVLTDFELHSIDFSQKT